MRSKAHVGSHPIHPALIPLPIGLAVAAALTDGVALWTGDAAWWVPGRTLAGAAIATAVLAALPGLMDLFLAIPPNSSARSRGYLHAVANSIALACLVAAVLVRRPLPSATPFVFVLAALGAMSVGGWLGGTLVFRNQIGVDHRHAADGSWREMRLSDVQAAPIVARADELLPGQMKLIHVNSMRIVLARTPDGWAAFEDHCSHLGGSLADGVLVGDCVQCPWHGSQFDVDTGAVRAGPAEARIRTWRAEEEDGEVRLYLAQHGEAYAPGIPAPSPLEI